MYAEDILRLNAANKDFSETPASAETPKVCAIALPFGNLRMKTFASKVSCLKFIYISNIYQ